MGDTPATSDTVIKIDSFIASLYSLFGFPSGKFVSGIVRSMAGEDDKMMLARSSKASTRQA
jgi:hypothetical protein